jgi:hypothetical protein
MLAEALFPSAVAVMSADPETIPTTIPVEETVAFVVSDDFQVTNRDSTWPEASLAVAESWNVAPGTRLAVSAERVTVAVVGGGGGGGPVASPHDPMIHPAAIAAAVRKSLFMTGAALTVGPRGLTQVTAHT